MQRLQDKNLPIIWGNQCWSCVTISQKKTSRSVCCCCRIRSRSSLIAVFLSLWGPSLKIAEYRCQKKHAKRSRVSTINFRHGLRACIMARQGHTSRLNRTLRLQEFQQPLIIRLHELKNSTRGTATEASVGSTPSSLEQPFAVPGLKGYKVQLEYLDLR